jgi:hypothetical protein
MACASCGRNKRTNNYIQPNALQIPPFSANDSMIIIDGNTSRLNNDNWDLDRHKIILFYADFNNEIFQSDMDTFSFWNDEFMKQETDLFISSTEPIGNIVNAMDGINCRALSSYILPLRLNLIVDGKTKNCTIIITNNGEVITIESPENVARNISDIHRIIYSYNNNEKYSESWKDPVMQ